MLTRRLLDSNSSKEPASKGTFGTKTFVFTDDLDVNNRLFEMIADAEGWNHAFKKPLRLGRLFNIKHQGA